MNRYRLVHVTEFRYDGPVSESYNEVRLRPLQDETQTCLSFRLTTDPPSNPSLHTDYFGNSVHRLNVLAEHTRLRIEADSVVLVEQPHERVTGGVSLHELPDLADELEEYYELLAPTTYVPHSDEVRRLVEIAEQNSDGTVTGFVAAASALVNSTFRYEKGATQVHSCIEDALKNAAGVCQDFAHVSLAIVRARGIPGRYVSGYIVPARTAEPGASVEEVIGGQASHAWMEAYIPGFGWLGVDPTLGKPIGLQHIRIGYGRDYGDVAPVRGVYKGHAGQHLYVDVRVRPALDDDGAERLEETSATPPELLAAAAAQQQQQ